VGVGDLFLFFGWFRQIVETEGVMAFQPGSPDLHVIFGWLQVGWLFKPTTKPDEVPKWAKEHPHVVGAAVQEANNTLYVSTKKLKIEGLKAGLPGGGVFRRYSPKLQLTADGAKRSLWRLPSCFYPNGDTPPLSYHANSSRWHRDESGVLLESVARGQEFVLDCYENQPVLKWIGDLFGAIAS